MCTFSGGRGGRPYLCFCLLGGNMKEHHTQASCFHGSRRHDGAGDTPFRKVAGILQNILPH